MDNDNKNKLEDNKKVLPHEILTSGLKMNFLSLWKNFETSYKRVNNEIINPLKSIALANQLNLQDIYTSINKISTSEIIRNLQSTVDKQNKIQVNNFLSFSKWIYSNPQEFQRISKEITSIAANIQPIFNSVEKLLAISGIEPFNALLNSALKVTDGLSKLNINDSRGSIDEIVTLIKDNNVIFNKDYINEIREKEIQFLKEQYRHHDFNESEISILTNEEVFSRIENYEPIDAGTLLKKYNLTNKLISFVNLVNERVNKVNGIMTLISLLLSFLSIFQSLQQSSSQSYIFRPTYNTINITNDPNFIGKEGKYNYFVSSNQGIIRYDCNRKASVRCKLPQNHLVKLIDSVGTWMLVSYTSIINDNEVQESGWINKRHLKKIKNVSF